jgi:hypothetical protein
MADFLHNNDETLMRYLDGEMNQTEREEFELQLQNDAVLKERLDSLKIAVVSIKQYGTIEKVRSVHSQMMQELSFEKREAKVVPVKRIVKYSLAIAASIIIVLVGVNFFTSSQLSSEKLYNEAFVDYDASGSRTNEQQPEITSLYGAHNYTAVVGKANSQGLSQKDSLLVGLSYLKTNQLHKAASWFATISQQSPVKQDAEFYLAMTYLKNKNYGEAVRLMEQIHGNPSHVYHNQFAEDYIDKVKKLGSK